MTVTELRALLAPLDGALQVVVDYGCQEDPLTACPLAGLDVGHYVPSGSVPEFGDFWPAERSAEKREVDEPINAVCLRPQS